MKNFQIQMMSEIPFYPILSAANYNRDAGYVKESEHKMLNGHPRLSRDAFSSQRCLQTPVSVL
jgi:hypothetical protein